MKSPIPAIAILLAGALAACNATDVERFKTQRASYIFASTTSTLTAYGADMLETEELHFRCPSISGMSSDSLVTPTYLRANAPLPNITIKTIQGVRSDAQSAFGFSLSNLPAGMFDIYQRCNASSTEKYVTSCPRDYTIVDDCAQADSYVKSCMLVKEGSHKLVISAHPEDDKACYSEEIDRTPYALSAPDAVFACDAFSPIPLAAAYRGGPPSYECCAQEAQTTINFCVRPCGCRTLNVQIVPKEETLQNAKETPSENADFANHLRLAVFSNVEGNTKRFEKLLASIKEHHADAAISLGNLTNSGKEAQFKIIHDLVKASFFTFDGQDEDEGCILSSSNYYCCPSNARTYPNLCNAILQKTAFLSGLGEDEFKGSGVTHFSQYFGPSNFATTIGKVQLIMLDTAEASVSDAQMTWLRTQLEDIPQTKCKIPKPTAFEKWPTLAECSEMHPEVDDITCRECIAQEAYCLPPAADRSAPRNGPENCICVPYTAKYCLDGLTCEAEDGQEHDCICTRDEDCGAGATCTDGKCTPPIRLVFSYTPIFDVYGSRNNAFSSRDQAAELTALFLKSHVNAIFSGKILDYSETEMAGIPQYITGGGGADMPALASKSNHWLMIDIPRAYTNPDPSQVTVTPIEF